MTRTVVVVSSLKKNNTLTSSVNLKNVLEGILSLRSPNKRNHKLRCSSNNGATTGKMLLNSISSRPAWKYNPSGFDIEVTECFFIVRVDYLHQLSYHTFYLT